MKNTNKVEIAISDKLINAVDEANKAGKRLTWVQAWSSWTYQNYISGKTFNGINPLLCAVFNQTSDIEFMTVKQANALGYHLTKDAKGKGVPIVFATVKEYNLKDENGNIVNDEDGNPVVRKWFTERYSTEWSLSYFVDENGNHPESKLKDKDNKKIAAPESIVKNYLSKNPELKLVNDKYSKDSYYTPARDTITLPSIECFDNSNEYYSTLFHEMTHSTGNQKRLNRKIMHELVHSKEEYSFEELVAEIGSAMLMNLAGIDTDATFKNSAAYLQSWLKVLKDNPTWLFKATAQAEKAVKLITDGMLDDKGTLKPEYIFTPSTNNELKSEEKTAKTSEKTSVQSTKNELTSTKKVYDETFTCKNGNCEYKIRFDSVENLNPSEFSGFMKNVFPVMADDDKKHMIELLENYYKDHEFNNFAKNNLVKLKTHFFTVKKLSYKSIVNYILKQKRTYISREDDNLYFSDTYMAIKVSCADYETIKTYFPDVPEIENNQTVTRNVNNVKYVSSDHRDIAGMFNKYEAKDKTPVSNEEYELKDHADKLITKYHKVDDKFGINSKYYKLFNKFGIESIKYRGWYRVDNAEFTAMFGGTRIA